MGSYKWLGAPPLYRSVLTFQGEEIHPGSTVPDGLAPEAIKSLLKKGKIEKVGGKGKTELTFDGPPLCLDDVTELNDAQFDALTGAGYENANAVVNAGEVELCKIDGIGKAKAAAMIEVCLAALKGISDET